MTGHSTTNHHQLWTEAEGKEKRSQRPRIMLRINCSLLKVWLPPNFPNQNSLSGLPVGRMQLPRCTPSKTFSDGTWILNRDSSSSTTALPSCSYPTDLGSVGLMSRFLAVLTEEQLSASTTKIWRVRFFRYSFCFTSLICLKVKEKRREYSFLTRLEKDPKIWIQEVQGTCSLAL